MNIKEIAERVSKRIYVEDGLLLSKFISEKFAEALIAELAKQNEPCVFLHEWIEYPPLGDTYAGKRCATITNDEKPFDSSDTVSPLFTFPPDKAQIEQETAEACARFCDYKHNQPVELIEVAKTQSECAEGIRSGAWKEFK